jgi:hypothetical protein
VDALARDGPAALALLEGRELADEVAQAAELLATVIGQDIETRDDGTSALACRVAPDRVVSAVDYEARHGRKTASQRFDGYKGHIAADPDSEIITDTALTPANTGDAEVTEKLPSKFADADENADRAADEAVGDDGDADDEGQGPAIYGDAAYGGGDNLERLERLGADPKVKPQPATAPAGGFSKDDFDIDLAAATLTCRAGAAAPINFRGDGSGTAIFGAQSHGCPLRAQCTTAESGRTVTFTRHEQRLTAQPASATRAWQGDYQANRPKVEGKLGHLLCRCRGGRRARMRGRQGRAQDWQLLAAPRPDGGPRRAQNHKRMANHPHLSGAHPRWSVLHPGPHGPTCRVDGGAEASTGRRRPGPTDQPPSAAHGSFHTGHLDAVCSVSRLSRRPMSRYC